MRYTRDYIERFENDPCGCALCKRIQGVVKSRNPIEKMRAYYRKHDAKVSKAKVA
jgi:hypothetical protein